MNYKYLTFQNLQLPVCDQSAVFLYKLLLYCENVKRSNDFTGFDIRKKEIRNFLEQKKITLNYNEKPHQHYDKNTIIFNISHSVGWDLLRHLRNAVAHGSLTKSKNVLQLSDKNNGKLTMYGNLSDNLLLPLIDVIVSNRKLHKTR